MVDKFSGFSTKSTCRIKLCAVDTLLHPALKMSTPQSNSPKNAVNHPPTRPGKGTAFWLTIAAVIVSSFLSALDLTSIATALPTITKELNSGDSYVWVGSAYALSSTAILPLSGRLADIFGRRPIMLGSIFFFALGSALAGAAQSMNMLIAARSTLYYYFVVEFFELIAIIAVQGIGGGGIINLCQIIVSDLVSLQERGVYQGILGLTWSFASGIGPTLVRAYGLLVTLANLTLSREEPSLKRLLGDGSSVGITDLFLAEYRP